MNKRISLYIVIVIILFILTSCNQSDSLNYSDNQEEETISDSSCKNYYTKEEENLTADEIITKTIDNMNSFSNYYMEIIQFFYTDSFYDFDNYGKASIDTFCNDENSYKNITYLKTEPFSNKSILLVEGGLFQFYDKNSSKIYVQDNMYENNVDMGSYILLPLNKRLIYFLEEYFDESTFIKEPVEYYLHQDQRISELGSDKIFVIKQNYSESSNGANSEILYYIDCETFQIICTAENIYDLNAGENILTRNYVYKMYNLDSHEEITFDFDINWQDVECYEYLDDLGNTYKYEYVDDFGNITVVLDKDHNVVKN